MPTERPTRVSPEKRSSVAPSSLDLAVAERVLEKHAVVRAGRCAEPASWASWEHGVRCELERDPAEVENVLGRRAARLEREAAPKAVGSLERTRLENDARREERARLVDDPEVAEKRRALMQRLARSV